MSYLIMECAASYAVALDEEGRFVRVPNLGYEVGQEVDDVVIFDEGQLLAFEAQKARRTRRRVGLIAAAACLVVAVIAGGVVWRLPIGTVYMRINPEVSMEVNRSARARSSCAFSSSRRISPCSTRRRFKSARVKAFHLFPRNTPSPGSMHNPSSLCPLSFLLPLARMQCVPCMLFSFPGA